MAQEDRLQDRLPSAAPAKLGPYGSGCAVPVLGRDAIKRIAGARIGSATVNGDELTFREVGALPPWA